MYDHPQQKVGVACKIILCLPIAHVMAQAKQYNIGPEIGSYTLTAEYWLNKQGNKYKGTYL